MNEFFALLAQSLEVDLLKSVIVLCLAAAIHKMDPEKPKKANFSFRLDPELRERLDHACRKVDEEDTGAVVRACIRAYVETVERDGEIKKPFAIVSKKDLAGMSERPAKDAFAEAGERTHAPVGGPSIPSLARVSPGAPSLVLNEADSGAPPAPRSAESSKRPVTYSRGKKHKPHSTK